MSIFIGIAIGLSIAVGISMLACFRIGALADRDWQRILNEHKSGRTDGSGAGEAFPPTATEIIGSASKS